VRLGYVLSDQTIKVAFSQELLSLFPSLALEYWPLIPTGIVKPIDFPTWLFLMLDDRCLK
jgi:hypothetical protein